MKSWSSLEDKLRRKSLEIESLGELDDLVGVRVILLFRADMAAAGELLASTQEERIKEEMIVATLDAGLLARERSLANYMLRTRRPELFSELLRDQTSS